MCEAICFWPAAITAAAEQNYYLAFTVARRQCAKLEELRAAMSMARLWRDQGKG